MLFLNPASHVEIVRIHSAAVPSLANRGNDTNIQIRDRSQGYTRAMRHDVTQLLPLSLDPNPVIEAYKPDVDRTLLRENLKLTTSQRVEKMIAALRFAEAVRHSRVKVDAR